MLRLTQPVRTANGTVHRRTALLAGSLPWFPGLSHLLRAENAVGSASTGRSLINIHLDGGPPHLDTIDPKPEAPVEIRGEFGTIETQLPGFRVSELLPRTAAIADRLVFIRSLVGSAGAHDAFQCQSGYRAADLKSFGGRPAAGSVISHLLAQATDSAPSFIDLMQGRPLVRKSARPGFLGPAAQPFRPDISRMFHRELETGMKGELARLGTDHSISLTLNPLLSEGRVNQRQQLLRQLDRLQRQMDSSGMMDAMDQFDRQAAGILMSGSLAEALDLEREDPSILRRFTAPGSDQGRQSTTSEGPDSVRKFLLARRLVQAGARCVSVSISDFDTHSDNFPRMRNLLPIVDFGLHALILDLEEQGLLERTTIVVWGEFGRTPRIDPKTGGRHHWPAVGPAVIAGGGLRTGVVVGETDRTGDSVRSRPVHYKDVFATLFHTLGIDARTTTLTDPQGRPQFILDEGEVISEII